jgi:uridine monophosphate synthetase
MKTTFMQFLESRVKEVDSLLCVGLDPHLAELASPTVESLRSYCLRLIEQTSQYAAAFKPNSAFFEAFGPPGMQALQEIIATVPVGIPVILDAKRGDIASTAEAYGRAAFLAYGAQAITASPYLGYDSLEPLLRDPSRGVFLLCKTSNPGSGDLQDQALLADGRPLYEHVARLAVQWNMNSNLGLVAGATHPEALQRIRQAAPQEWILAPGVGAQGGELNTALRAGLRIDGLGLLITVSRALARAEQPSTAARRLRDEINTARQAIWATPTWASALSEAEQRLADALLEAGCVRFGNFTLKSGLLSPIYIDLRRLIDSPMLLAQVAGAYLPVLRGIEFDRLAALPYAAIPIATAISLQANWPLIYPRKEVKAYGTRAEIEGSFTPGEKVVVIDDLTTTGGSKFEAIERLTSAGLSVQDVVVLIDRQSGAKEALEKAGYRLHAVLRLSELLDYWSMTGRIEAGQLASVREFIGQNGEIKP